ncbi:hypothetical protein ON010_g15670 [Phytophthora cinnamomi]|nr:hypothetical protein ON010_g15670 [Phytophthora cinnamomi]
MESPEAVAIFLRPTRRECRATTAVYVLHNGCAVGAETVALGVERRRSLLRNALLGTARGSPLPVWLSPAKPPRAATDCGPYQSRHRQYGSANQITTTEDIGENVKTKSVTLMSLRAKITLVGRSDRSDSLLILSLAKPNQVYKFFYDNVPRGSMCIREAPALKQSKSRITLAVCTNATDTHKLPLLFIGKSRQPRWIKNKPDDIDYKHVLLLLDNASSHSEEGVPLTNVRVEKLPANTTSKLQPLDQGVIYCLKRAVLRTKMNHALEKIDEGVENPYKVGMLQGIKWCAAAWEELSGATIEHCWLHSTLIKKSDIGFILS